MKIYRGKKAGLTRPLQVFGVLGLVLAAVLVAGGLRLRRPHASTAPDGVWFRVMPGPLTINIVESGTVNPRERQIIKNEIEGRSTILYLIPEGTRVQAGDLLVELDASQLMDNKIDQEIQVQNAEAAFIQARENLEVVKNQTQSDIDRATLTLRFAGEDLEQYKEGEYPNALKELEARITLAREELQRATEKVKWSKVLFAEKYVSESELQADELAAKKADLDVALAEDNLKLLKAFTYKRKLAELESDVSQAMLALARVERKASADIVQAEAALRAKESEFSRQKDKLAKLTEQIAKARIVAPRDGIVVYATSARISWRGNDEPLAEGQEVRERQELIHLPTASTFDAEIKVHESNLDRIRVGLPVSITIDALPGRVFAGEIATIAPLPDATSMFMNPDLKLYATVVRIDGGADVLRTGMSCQADIHVAQFDAAMQAPVQSVVRVDGVPTVYVRDGEKTIPRVVEIGLDNNRMVRIMSGLETGEEVLLAPPLTASTAAADAPSVEPVVPVAAGPVAAKARAMDGVTGADSASPGAAAPAESRRGDGAGSRRRPPAGAARPPRAAPESTP